MPKGKVQIKKGVQQIVARSHKIGGRKSTKAANMLSNSDLAKIVEGGARGRDKQRARMELTKRAA